MNRKKMLVVLLVVVVLMAPALVVANFLGDTEVVVARDEELLCEVYGPDIPCVALNQLSWRYVRK